MQSLLLALLFLVGCATTGRYQQVLQSWMGGDVNALIQSWGPPSDEYRMPSGESMYTWLWVGGTVVTVHEVEFLNLTMATQRTRWCKTTFVAGPSGRLRTWRWEGNACKR